MINPTQVTHTADRWIAITKEGDWWGSRIYLDAAPRATGPWTTVAILNAATVGPAENNYFASIITVDDHGGIVIGLSHNRWDGAQSSTYRPTFQTLHPPAPSDPTPRTPLTPLHPR
jgi:hypothetical protein